MKNFSRREFIKTVGFGGSLAAFSSWNEILFAAQKDNKRPNIIFIMSDDHASAAISCYGSRINKTPNIDRIARDGVRYTNCFCTNGICAPSRAVILTGKYSHINGQINNAVTFDGSQQTFPKLLQKAGYATAIIGKWHLRSAPTGFDYHNILPGQGDYYNPDFIEMGKKVRVKGYVTNLITDFSIDWIRKNRSVPFMLMCHHKAPHRNWLPDTKHYGMYRDNDIPEPENLYDDYSTRSDAAKTQKMSIANDLLPAYDLKLDKTPFNEADKKALNNAYDRMDADQKKAFDQAYATENEAFYKANLKGHELTGWKYQRYIKDYLRCVASVDDNIGRMLDYLDSSGLTQNTIVVYSSDQGLYIGEHGWFDKRFMYEESLRMPLLIRYPGTIKSGSVCDKMTMNLDFAPTLLDFAGCTVPADIQGRSLKPIMLGCTPNDWQNAMYYHYYEYPAEHSVKRHYGIRTDRYKLIHFYYDIDAWEFYDLQMDPHEMVNLYNDPTYTEVVNQVKTKLEDLRRRYGDSDELIKKPTD